MMYRASISSSAVSILRPRSIEVEFANSDGNIVPHRARLLSLFLAHEVVEENP